MRLHRRLLALVTAVAVASGSCVAALAATSLTSPNSLTSSSGVAAFAGQPRAAVTIGPVVVSGGSATITYSVNRYSVIVDAPVPTPPPRSPSRLPRPLDLG
jgi:hypothetical protein